ncbi:MAG: DUF1592 domain-containing protein [Bdellovibrionota bacterium]
MKTSIRVLKFAFATIVLSALYTNCSEFKVLKSTDLSSNETNSFTSLKCANPESVGATELRRLSKSELSNTLNELLGAPLAANLQPILSRLPSDKPNADAFENSYSDLHVSAFSDLAFNAANLVTGASLNGFLARHTACSSAASLTSPCVDSFIAKFGLRILRRPLSSSEATMFRSLYDSGSTPQEGLQIVLMTMFQSPQFLHHVEIGTEATGSDTEFEVTPYEVASRIPYALWDSMPSDALFAAAAAGDLQDSARLDAIVSGMIDDPRTKDKLKGFFAYWLNTSALSNPSTNADFLNGLDTTGLVPEMKREMDQYIDHVIWQKRQGYEELMTSKTSFARTPALAEIYEHTLAANPDDGSQTMGGPRKGLLLRAPLLFASDDETHPILRGATLRKRILCDQMGLPSNDAFGVRLDVDTVEFITEHTLRERITEKTSGGSCAGCHSMINPIGFVLEGYDALGRRRSTEKAYDSTEQLIAEHRIDSSVTNLRIDSDGPSAASSGEELVDIIANSDKGSACFARQTFRYFNFRSEDITQDGCSLKGIRDSIVGQNGSITEGLKRTVMNRALNKKIVKGAP